MFGFQNNPSVFSSAVVTKAWNEDKFVPEHELLHDFGPLGSPRPSEDEGVDIYDDLSLGIIPKHEILHDFGPIGMGRPLPPPRLEMAAPEPRRATSLPSFLEDNSSPSTTTITTATSSSFISSSSSVPEVMAPSDWSDASVWQQHLEVLKQREEQDAIAEGRPERRLNHQTGAFLNVPAKQKAWKRSRNQYIVAQQCWAEEYTSAVTQASDWVVDAESSTQSHQALRPGAAEFVPNWVA